MTQRKSRYVLILWDRDTNAQITASFNDINSIDQVPPALVRNLKQYNEQHQRKIIKAEDVDIDKVISEIKWVQ